MVWQGKHRTRRAESEMAKPEPLIVTNPDGTREPWSLEWQVRDDARYYLERNVRRMLGDESGNDL